MKSRFIGSQVRGALSEQDGVGREGGGEEVQQIVTEWLWAYNNRRRKMGIGGLKRHEAEIGFVRITVAPLEQGGLPPGVFTSSLTD